MSLLFISIYILASLATLAPCAGSKWTAMERTFGWRHFRVMQKKGQGKGTFVLMTATCDESTQFWVRGPGWVSSTWHCPLGLC